MKKYYIEIWHHNIEFEKPYVVQSKWFDDEIEAIEWTDGMYLDSSFTASLMSAEFDDEGNYGDIKFEYHIYEEFKSTK